MVQFISENVVLVQTVHTFLLHLFYVDFLSCLDLVEIRVVFCCTLVKPNIGDGDIAVLSLFLIFDTPLNYIQIIIDPLR